MTDSRKSSTSSYMSFQCKIVNTIEKAIDSVTLDELHNEENTSSSKKCANKIFQELWSTCIEKNKRRAVLRKARMLIPNLKRNQVLCQQLLDGELLIKEFCSMPLIEMAPASIREQARQFEEKQKNNKVLPQEDPSVSYIRKTKNHYLEKNRAELLKDNESRFHTTLIEQEEKDCIYKLTLLDPADDYWEQVDRDDGSGVECSYLEMEDSGDLVEVCDEKSHHELLISIIVQIYHSIGMFYSMEYLLKNDLDPHSILEQLQHTLGWKIQLIPNPQNGTLVDVCVNHIVLFSCVYKTRIIAQSFIQFSKNWFRLIRYVHYWKAKEKEEGVLDEEGRKFHHYLNYAGQKKMFQIERVYENFRCCIKINGATLVDIVTESLKTSKALTIDTINNFFQSIEEKTSSITSTDNSNSSEQKVRPIHKIIWNEVEDQNYSRDFIDLLVHKRFFFESCRLSTKQNQRLLDHIEENTGLKIIISNPTLSDTEFSVEIQVLLPQHSYSKSLGKVSSSQSHETTLLAKKLIVENLIDLSSRWTKAIVFFHRKDTNESTICDLLNQMKTKKILKIEKRIRRRPKYGDHMDVVIDNMILVRGTKRNETVNEFRKEVMDDVFFYMKKLMLCHFEFSTIQRLPFIEENPTNTMEWYPLEDPIYCKTLITILIDKNKQLLDIQNALTSKTKTSKQVIDEIANVTSLQIRMNPPTLWEGKLHIEMLVLIPGQSFKKPWRRIIYEKTHCDPLPLLKRLFYLSIQWCQALSQFHRHPNSTPCNFLNLLVLKKILKVEKRNGISYEIVIEGMVMIQRLKKNESFKTVKSKAMEEFVEYFRTFACNISRLPPLQPPTLNWRPLKDPSYCKAIIDKLVREKKYLESLNVVGKSTTLNENEKLRQRQSLHECLKKIQKITELQILISIPQNSHQEYFVDVFLEIPGHTFQKSWLRVSSSCKAGLQFVAYENLLERLVQLSSSWNKVIDYILNRKELCEVNIWETLNHLQTQNILQVQKLIDQTSISEKQYILKFNDMVLFHETQGKNEALKKFKKRVRTNVYHYFNALISAFKESNSSLETLNYYSFSNVKSLDMRSMNMRSMKRERGHYENQQPIYYKRIKYEK